jgi:mannose/cellobiose epimerase-like protein (N-acyl-D-glucosamine 2-epimerase family)
MKNYREMSSERLRNGGSGLIDSILLRTVPTWVGVGCADFGAPCDPVGALRFPATAPFATLCVQAQIVSVRARMAAAGIGAAKASSFPSFLASLLAHFLSPDGESGLAEIVAANGKVFDARRSLDGHSWMLRALADSFVATRSRDMLLVSDLILEFLDSHLANHSIGYFEDNQGGGWRRQSSHATLLEAILTLHFATGSERYLKRAAALFELFRDHLLDRARLNIGEIFDRNWHPAPDSSVFHPAAHARWVALLGRYHAASGDTQALDLMRALGARLLRQRDDRGMIVSAMDANGAIADGSLKLRDQVLLCAALQVLGADERRLHSELRFLESRIAALFIDPAPAGCWCESVDARGESQGAPIAMETLVAMIAYVANARRAGARAPSQKEAMHAA